LSTPDLVVDQPAQLAGLLPRLLAASTLAIDVESNGLFVYRQRLCTVQIAWQEAGSVAVAVVDTLALGGEPLAALLSEDGPVKILHDLAFDARILAANGVILGRVRDTSVVARFLGRKSLGLGSLLAAELGITVDKALQHHDWSKRPITSDQLVYLGNDVRHLFALDEKLTTEAEAKGLSAYVADETSYKLAEAIRPPEPTKAPHLRLKGATDLPRARIPLLRRLHAARERLASDADLPAFKILPPDVLVVLAREAPTDGARIARLLGTKIASSEAQEPFLAALRDGRTDTTLDEDERGVLDRRPPSPADRKAYKRREDRLRAFRRRESEQTHVDEQAILPGHCASALAEEAPTTLEALRAIRGLGEARINRYGATLLDLLRLSDDEAT
jgi:ribonuclease D